MKQHRLSVGLAVLEESLCPLFCYFLQTLDSWNDYMEYVW